MDKLARRAEYHFGARVLSGDPGQVAGIAAVDIHPRFHTLPSPTDPDNPNAASAAYDVAVVTLDHPIRGVPALPVASQAPGDGTFAVLYGHGITGPPNPRDPESIRGDVLRRGVYQIRPDHRCAQHTPTTVDAESMLCGRGLCAEACSGDSGGQLVTWAHGRRELAGVFSFGMEIAGKSCGAPGPNFFTDTAALHSWISDQKGSRP